MRSNSQENFYKRLKQLGGVNSASNTPTNLSNSTLIDYRKADDGISLGIVKENHNYFIKTSNSKGEKLGADDFAYIGGIENKFKYQYNSLAEAEKNRNFYLQTLNESTSKKFKRIAINESENIGNAQSNADTLKADKAQDEADKNMKDSAKASTNAKEVEPAKVPSAKEISVEKQATAKVVDDTKESKSKAIAVEKQATAKVVKENEEKPFPPAEDGAAVAPAVPSPESTPMGDEPAATATPDAGVEGGEEGADLDAAADALQDMGATDGVDANAAADQSAPMPDAASNDGSTDVPTDDEASVKDIEKLTGKITQKIRSTNLTPEMTKGFLKSYITSFEDKLGELDHEDRKELANAILKDKSDDDMGISDDSTASTSPEDEKDIEETISAHLAEMGIGGDAGLEDEQQDNPSFKNYMQDRGYNPEKVNEISLMEMVSLVNGYTNECADNIESADAHGIAEFVTPEVSEKIQESGNAIFENLMKPFGDKIKKNKKAYATEAVIPSINENFGDDEEGDDEGQEGEEVAGADEIGTDDTNGENDPASSIAVGEDEPSLDDAGEEETSLEIAPAGQTIALGAPSTTTGNVSSGSKSVTVDLNNNTVSMSMNESNLEKIIKKKIEEQLSGKKSTINENKKSALSTMIDELVNEAIIKRRAAIEKRLSQR